MTSKLELELIRSALGGDDSARWALMDYSLEGGRDSVAEFWRMSAERSVGRIDSLSDYAKSLFLVATEYWMTTGMSTAEMDRDEVRSAISDAYSQADKDPPEVFIFLDGPIHGCIGAYMLSNVWDQVRDQVWDQVGDQVWGQVGDQVRGQVRGQVWDQVWDQVGDQVWGQVGDQVRGQVWDQVRGQVWGQVGDQVRGQVRDQVGDQVWDQVRDQVWDQVRDQVRAQVRDQVWDQVRGQVWDQVRGQVWDQVRDQVGDQVWDQIYQCCYGSHDSGWLSFYSFFDLVGLGCCQKLKPLMAVARHSGWWWPFENACIVTGKPSELVMESGKLKRIAYRDGTEVNR